MCSNKKFLKLGINVVKDVVVRAAKVRTGRNQLDTPTVQYLFPLDFHEIADLKKQNLTRKPTRHAAVNAGQRIKETVPEEHENNE